MGEQIGRAAKWIEGRDLAGDEFWWMMWNECHLAEKMKRQKQAAEIGRMGWQ
jgi:hypothetical protein